ncbi:MAG: TAXI family TRAP transporter solute-binding subunit [Burkholderiales bacterium]
MDKPARPPRLRRIRATLLSVRDLTITAGPFIALALVLLLGAYFVLKPTPPRRVVLATGPEQSAYAAFGERYRQELARHRIEVVLQASPGSRENLRMLLDEKHSVDIAFVQGGSSESARMQKEAAAGLPLVSLGSLFYEPVWIFYRAEAAKAAPAETFTQLAQFRGLKVNVGARGSGSPGLFGRLLQDNLMERDDVVRQRLDLTPSVVALLGGEIDAAVMVSAPESPLVQMLLQTPGIRTFEFTQAEAYARRRPFLSPVTLPRGVADLSRDVPPRDIPLLATTTSLVAREDTHPALQQLFVQAAAKIHGDGGWIARAGQFPTASQTEFPLSSEADRYYRSGRPVLQRYLPFWLANLIDRMWVALVTIIAVLIPLSRVVPPLYAFRIRSRVFRWYRVLREIEDRLHDEGADLAALAERLDKLDATVERVPLPLAYTDELYALRQHIRLVREKLDAVRPAGG